MRFLRLALVLLAAFLLRGAIRRPAHFDLSTSYSSHISDRKSIDEVTARLNSWEHQLRAHGFNSITSGSGTAVKVNADGKEERTESHDVTLVGKLDNLGHVRVRIRTNQDLEASEQVVVDVQAQKKSDYEQAWEELGERVQGLLRPH